MGRRDHAQPCVDRIDGARVLLAVEEADGIAQDGDGLIDACGDSVRVAARLPQRQVLQLLAVVERRAGLELTDAALDALAQRLHGRAPQQGVVGLDVGVDRQHVDAVGAQEPGQGGHRQVWRRRITGWWIDEGDLHVLLRGRRSIPGRRGIVHLRTRRALDSTVILR